jgi:hypothetical protein
MAKEVPFPTSSSNVGVILYQNAQGRSWIFKHGHDFLALRLVTRIHSFEFVALQLF